MNAFLKLFVISAFAIVPNLALADTKELIVNGETPQAYFQKFLYHTSGSCHAEHGIWFHFVETLEDSFKLPDADIGRQRRANLALYLSENGEYSADLTDEIFYEKSGDIETFRIVSKQRLNGKWAVTEDGRLDIEGIGRGSALLYNGNPAIDFRIDDNFAQAYLRKQSIVLVPVVGSGGKDPYEEVCGK
jgi:hypothetical protein